MSDTSDPSLEASPTAPAQRDTDSQHAWILEHLGLDTRDPTDSISARDSSSNEQVAVLDPSEKEKAEPAPSQPAAPGEPSGSAGPATPTVVKLTLTSETEVTQPADRTRTKIGVGERVTLKLSPVGGDWKASGSGTVKPAKGSTVVLTAAGKAGKVTVSVTAQGKTETIVFTVVAPSSVHLDTVSTEHYNVGVPNAGFYGQVFCGPDDVNFVNITFIEDEIGCVASGSWASKNGKGHGPNTSPLGFSDKVESGKGTKSFAKDHCWSGYVPGLSLTDWTGNMTFQIPWRYECNKVKGKIATVAMITSTAADGTTSTKKAGGSSGDHALS